MNKNIEVIDKHLYAVRFSLIPYIKEIDYHPHRFMPAFTEPVSLMENGMLLLNKDHRNYKLLKDSFINLAKKTPGWLKKQQKKGAKLILKTSTQDLYFSLIDIEIKRRVLAKKSKRKRR